MSSDFLHRWFAPLLQQGPLFCAPNLDTQLAFLRTDHCEIPLTINDAQWDNSWICSPWTHYVSYAQEEIARARVPILGTSARLALRAAGTWMRHAEFNRVVMLNNWLLSTSAWPKTAAADLPQILQMLLQQWPDHAYVFRSLNEKESTPLIAALRALGARLIPSRQVWWHEPDSPAVARSRDFRADVNLLHSNDLAWVRHDELTEADFPSLAHLYWQLYVNKYSRHNPQFTVGWLQHLWRERLLNFSALRTVTGQHVGLEACGELNGVLTSPIIGYDLAQPRHLGLYRRLAAIPVLEARRQQLPLNLSSGVAHFKALRGGEPLMEYLAVFDRHLPPQRRKPWAAVQWLSEHVLAPWVEKQVKM